MKRAPVKHEIGYWAAIGHRVSGLALVIFLPLHFLILGTALEGAEAMDRWLSFAELPLVKVAEWGLVVLLSLHLLFGLRVLILEFLPWGGLRHGWIWGGAVASLMMGVVFLTRAF
ncbi:succinate dehydrogenase, cytochrome b556 subunit [Rhodobacteraceae bacterium NNCM2]|nr:succinate dehydrogenase, cytochrome b556 subunit [Coraliihabitans acroporae]